MKVKGMWIRLFSLALALLMVVAVFAACEGAQGPAGEKGEKGDKGETGATGLNGINGIDGNLWSVGEGIPTAEAKKGDMYLDTATNDIYQYNGSAWSRVACIKGEAGDDGEPGTPGTPGTPGEPGAAGNKWYTGVGAPTALTGMIAGDLYLDLSAGEVYQYGTAWEKIGSIKGVEGDPGEPGEPGTPGEPGADGSKWYTGAGAPAIDAKESDMYYDTASGKIYQYQSNAWVELSKPLTEKEKELQELLTLNHGIQLKADENGDFRVVMFSDIHFYSAGELAASDTLTYINNIIDKEEPDLVLFAGDNWWSLDTAEKFEAYVLKLTEHIREKQIPWAHVYGNHDDEINMGGWYSSIHQSEQQRICETIPYCVSKAGEEYLSGTGNYVLPIWNQEGTKILYNVWALDSGSYAHDSDADKFTDTFTDMYGVQHTTEFYGKYEGIQRNQVDWYVKTSQLLEEYNGEKIPAMMYFHIPLQETHTAFKLATLPAGSQKPANPYNMTVTGIKNGNICVPKYNAGLFDAAVERGDVKLMAYGHDHTSDFTVEYRDINMCYIPAITTRSGVTGANNELMGGRVIDFGADGEFTTRMSYVKQPVIADPNRPILNLNIGANKESVTNAATYGPELTYHNQGATDATVVYDEQLGKNVLHFNGHGSTPSVYNIALPNTKYTSMFADGFYFEVMFKMDVIPTTDMGIIDYVNSGGFGLNVLNGGTLRLEFGRGNSYEEWKITNAIEKDKWYHVVFRFDGTETALYVNGVKVTTDQTGVTHKALTDGYRQPVFESRTGEEYLCIGGCAVAWQSSNKSQGNCGMTGSIAMANLAPTMITEAQALALYQASGIAPTT